jgi:glycosyltransferase involved in cell wall biosynthesis
MTDMSSFNLGESRPPLRILEVNDLGEGGAGAETYMLALIERLQASGHSVELFSASTPLPSSRSPSTWWNEKEAVRIRKVLSSFRPDLVHIHNTAYLSPSVLAEARRLVPRVVMTIHDYRHEPLPRIPGEKSSFFPMELLNRTKRRFVRNHLRETCTTFTAPSRDLAERTRDWAGDVPVFHVPYPIDSTSEPREMDPDAPFLYVGRLVEEKGLRTLIRSIERFTRPLRIRVVGAGPLSKTLAEHPRVEYLGPKPREAIPALIDACRALVVPSEWLENYPLSILEAQARGRAVIATHVGGLPEMVEDGISGFLVPPFSPDDLALALDRLALDGGLCREMGRQGLARVRRENRAEDCDAALLAAALSDEPVPAVEGLTKGWLEQG